MLHPVKWRSSYLFFLKLASSKSLIQLFALTTRPLLSRLLALWSRASKLLYILIRHFTQMARRLFLSHFLDFQANSLLTFYVTISFHHRIRISHLRSPKSSMSFVHDLGRCRFTLPYAQFLFWRIGYQCF